MRKVSYLSRGLADDAVQCQACEHFCAIEVGASGRCGVRRNIDGELHLVVYGEPIAAHVDPIEKKPLFHFLPGGSVFSIGTFGCNFRCSFCQNWQMSQTRDFDDQRHIGQPFEPQAIVDLCVRDDIPMIAYTYNEPTVFFEYTYDTARLAHERGIKNIYVSNGYMSEAALNRIEPYLDAINVDLKAFDDGFYREQCGARLAPVKRNIAHIAQNTDVWIEVTTLLIPGLNDSEAEIQAMVEWLVSVDPDIPWHISAFHPDYKMLDRPPTPHTSLMRAYELGRQAGLRYVYMGNVADSERGSTRCPGCGRLLVQRDWYRVREVWRHRGVCPHCEQSIAGVWS
ncbi:MAG: AmmeMemoRadiSam system radical SAM enzyme [Chloroflexi bacterium]|nr:AmmeMemoRadiSam system radical SAM enzyme [Chloroflexota bacterium]